MDSAITNYNVDRITSWITDPDSAALARLTLSAAPEDQP